MQFRGVLIHGSGRLGAAVAIIAVERESADGMLAENAFERYAAVHLFGGVVSHVFIVVPLAAKFRGMRCWPFDWWM
jgi:hypothetical protein